ncbi:unnamed protein product [Closterium sp. NIES-53]
MSAASRHCVDVSEQWCWCEWGAGVAVGLVWLWGWCGCGAGVAVVLVWLWGWCGCGAGVAVGLVWLWCWCGCGAGVAVVLVWLWGWCGCGAGVAVWLVWLWCWCGCGAGVAVGLVWLWGWCGCGAGVAVGLVWLWGWCGCGAGCLVAWVARIFSALLATYPLSSPLLFSQLLFSPPSSSPLLSSSLISSSLLPLPLLSSSLSSLLLPFPLLSSPLLSSHLISSPLLLASPLLSSPLLSSHLISSHLISSHLISSHLISSHLISSHLISSHSSHLISSHSSHLISSSLLFSDSALLSQPHTTPLSSLPGSHHHSQLHVLLSVSLITPLNPTPPLSHPSITGPNHHNHPRALLTAPLILPWSLEAPQYGTVPWTLHREAVPLRALIPRCCHACRTGTPLSALPLCSCIDQLLLSCTQAGAATEYKSAARGAAEEFGSATRGAAAEESAAASGTEARGAEASKAAAAAAAARGGGGGIPAAGGTGAAIASQWHPGCSCPTTHPPSTKCNGIGTAKGSSQDQLRWAAGQVRRVEGKESVANEIRIVNIQRGAPVEVALWSSSLGLVPSSSRSPTPTSPPSVASPAPQPGPVAGPNAQVTPSSLPPAQPLDPPPISPRFPCVDLRLGLRLHLTILTCDSGCRCLPVRFCCADFKCSSNHLPWRTHPGRYIGEGGRGGGGGGAGGVTVSAALTGRLFCSPGGAAPAVVSPCLCSTVWVVLGLQWYKQALIVAQLCSPYLAPAVAPAPPPAPVPVLAPAPAPAFAPAPCLHVCRCLLQAPAGSFPKTRLRIAVPNKQVLPYCSAPEEGYSHPKALCPVLPCAALCCPVLPCAALCCPVLPCAILWCSVLPCAVLCCPLLPCAALCCPLLTYVALLFAPLAGWQTYDAAVGDITVLDSRSKVVFFTYPIQVPARARPVGAIPS